MILITVAISPLAIGQSLRGAIDQSHPKDAIELSLSCIRPYAGVRLPNRFFAASRKDCHFKGTTGIPPYPTEYGKASLQDLNSQLEFYRWDLDTTFPTVRSSWVMASSINHMDMETRDP